MFSVKADPEGEGYGVTVRCEGDLDCRWFPTRAQLIAHIDQAAAWYFERSPYDIGYDPDDPKFKGPFSWERCNQAKEQT